MNGTVHLLCGKIASGKSTYARRMQRKSPALLFSCDELVRQILPGDLGEAHDEILLRVKQYLFNKAAEAARCGVDVILDWGFWSREDRRFAAEFFVGQSIPVLRYYIAVSDAEWSRNIARRNTEIICSENQLDYSVDAGLLGKLESLFEEPSREEIDIWVENLQESEEAGK